jgi:hypothetical protein
MLTNAISRPAWWLEPARLVLFVVLPIFLATATYGPYGFGYFQNDVNNIDPYTIGLGIGSILAFCAGALIVVPFKPLSSGPVGIDLLRGTNVLRVLGVVSIVAHLILLGPVIFRPDLIIDLFSGSSSAIYEVRETWAKTPGITSFTQVGVVFSSVLAALRLNSDYRMPVDVRLIFLALTGCIISRALLGAERLALIEFVIPLFLASIAFHWRPSLLRTFTPLWAIVGLFIIFSFTEFFRSWQHYQYLGYDSYLTFALLRLFGYISTSINNAAGILLHFDPIGYPAATASWFYKLPLWSPLGIEIDNPAKIVEQYLLRFASPEFNNVSGLYLPFIDYGFAFGLLFMAVIGGLSEALYQRFMQLQPVGLIIYPTWYVGMLDLIRLFYWGDPRYFPIFVPALCVAWFLGVNTSRRRSGANMTGGWNLRAKD